MVTLIFAFMEDIDITHKKIKEILTIDIGNTKNYLPVDINIHKDVCLDLYQTSDIKVENDVLIVNMTVQYGLMRKTGLELYDVEDTDTLISNIETDNNIKISIPDKHTMTKVCSAILLNLFDLEDQLYELDKCSIYGEGE